MSLDISEKRFYNISTVSGFALCDHFTCFRYFGKQSSFGEHFKNKKVRLPKCTKDF